MSDQSPQTAQPVELDYAPPVARARRLTLLLGIGASVFFAVGSGFVSGGVMLGWRNDRDAPGFVAFGVGMIVFGIGVIVSAWISRR